jgi:hypothetical protein
METEKSRLQRACRRSHQIHRSGGALPGLGQNAMHADEAIPLFIKAANQGTKMAQVELGQVYEEATSSLWIWSRRINGIVSRHQERPSNPQRAWARFIATG